MRNKCRERFIWIFDLRTASGLLQGTLVQVEGIPVSMSSGFG